jgi:hypothetical protein
VFSIRSIELAFAQLPFKFSLWSSDGAQKSHETAQYIARTFTVQYKYMNIHSTKQYIYISTTQVHEHYETQYKTENIQNKMNILPGNEPGPSSNIF